MGVKRGLCGCWGGTVGCQEGVGFQGGCEVSGEDCGVHGIRRDCGVSRGGAVGYQK